MFQPSTVLSNICYQILQLKLSLPVKDLISESCSISRIKLFIFENKLHIVPRDQACLTADIDMIVKIAVHDNMKEDVTIRVVLLESWIGCPNLFHTYHGLLRLPKFYLERTVLWTEARIRRSARNQICINNSYIFKTLISLLQVRCPSSQIRTDTLELTNLQQDSLRCPKERGHFSGSRKKEMSKIRRNKYEWESIVPFGSSKNRENIQSYFTL